MAIPPFQPSPLPLWRQILRENFTRLDYLIEFLELSEGQKEQLLFKPRFPLNIPLRIAKKIQKGTLDDPLLKQFIPTQKENAESKGFSLDPVQDQLFRCESKLLHKYEGRVLLLCTSVCAMHCRFCFRQNFDYEIENKTFSKELKMIANDSSIHEVILSGGDPLSLTDERLSELLEELDKIPHVQRIRFHSRFPIGIPERIDESFLRIIESVSKQICFVIHANHPREFDAEIFERLKALQKLGCMMLCQSVLLKGINDREDVLRELYEILIDHGIIPYYLHQLDRVRGGAHFEVDEEIGRELMRKLLTVLPGYGVPKYVREVGGAPSKIVL